MNITAVVLAAGRSERMGENKLFLPYKGKPLVEHMISLLEMIPVKQRIIILSEDNAKRMVFPKQFTTVINPNPEEGQSASVRLGTKHACGDAILFCTGDQPFLDGNTLLTIMHHAAPNRIIIPTHQGRRGHPVCFGRKFKPELLLLRGEEGGKPIIRRYPEHCIFVEVDNPRALIDIDTPQEYKALLCEEI